MNTDRLSNINANFNYEQQKPMKTYRIRTLRFSARTSDVFAAAASVPQVKLRFIVGG